MDLEKVKQFTEEIDALRERILDAKQEINILNSLSVVTLVAHRYGGSDRNRFTISHDEAGVKLNSQSVDIFKTLAIKELTAEIAAKEKELEELIKKGIG